MNANVATPDRTAQRRRLLRRQRLATAFASGTVAACLALVAGEALRPAPLRLATLNVAQLFAERQAALVTLATEEAGQGGATRAVELARHFGQRLEAEVRALPRECGCVVLVRGAVVSSDALPDYTDLVRTRLGAP
jgi:hypothetical protein